MCVCVCVTQDTPSGRKKISSEAAPLQGKAPMWPKLPEPAGGTELQQDSRSDPRASSSASPNAQHLPRYVIAGFSVEAAHQTQQPATYQNQILTRTKGKLTSPRPV